ncbi:GerW family sporulation protein [Glaciibacter superstes]|uniref:GerW family sporulation protein n=1 Tax=Glaciibacter superstes TaxID=501023 RepID=UPI0003B31CA1|nr:spore germination protein GerW family protein [Glaciibacter superstes]
MTNLAVKLAENARTFGVTSAYGEPVEVEGVTIIPVALVQYGFGAGGDEDPADGSSGSGASGGGGGGMSVPIGAYVKSGGTVRFEPNVISLLAVGIPFVWVAGKAFARIIRALKR